MKPFFLIAVLVLVIQDQTLSQTFELTYTHNAPDRLVEMKLEDQFGEEWVLPENEGVPVIIFFLPKVSNRDDGKKEMGKISSYIRDIEETFDNKIQTLTIIEPYRTGLLINRVLQSRLRNKTFSIVTDSDANIINQSKEGMEEGLYFWIVDEEGKIIHRSSPGFSDKEWEMTLPTVKLQYPDQ